MSCTSILPPVGFNPEETFLLPCFACKPRALLLRLSIAQLCPGKRLKQTGVLKMRFAALSSLEFLYLTACQ